MGSQSAVADRFAPDPIVRHTILNNQTLVPANILHALTPLAYVSSADQLQTKEVLSNEDKFKQQKFLWQKFIGNQTSNTAILQPGTDYLYCL